MALKLFLSTLIFIISAPCFAEVTLQGITGASRRAGPLFGDVNPVVNTVYGGLSGTEAACSTKDNVNACNNCGSASIKTCNSTRIYDTLQLKITYVSNSTQGVILATTDVDDGQEVLDPPSTDVTIYNPNTPVTISIPWSEICNEVFNGGGGGCESGTLEFGSKNIRVGFDNQAATGNINNLNTADDDFIVVPIILAKMDTTVNAAVCNAGGTPSTTDGTTETAFPNVACNFIAYPGDEKVFIDDLRTGCSFPDVSGSDAADVRAVRVLHKEGSFPDPSTGTFTDLNVSDVSSCGSASSKIISLTENEVGGLENNKRYFFSLALVDEANNVGFFTSHTNTTETDSSSCFDSDQHPQNCHIAAPAKVTGLLEDEFDCFITTATYGSPFKPKVKVFRKFRNLFMKTNFIGQLIIKTYYKISPPIASWIRNNPQSKPVVRALLWPYWMISKILVSGRIMVLILMGFAFCFIAMKAFTKKKAQ